jgi:hypothetical protein
MTKPSLCLLLFFALFAARPAHAHDWAVLMESPQIGGIRTFANRSDGTFVSCEVNGNSAGASFTATSHGVPGGGGVGQVSAHFHNSNTDFYAFTRTSGGNLYLRYAPSAFNDDTPSWSWHNLGKPANTTLKSDPASISFGAYEWVFLLGADQQLYSVRGAPWVWGAHGTPAAGVALVGRPSSVVWADSLYTFVIGDDGQLYLRTWNGIAWNWVAAGAPTGVLLEGSPAAAKYGSTIQVFVRGDDDRLYVREWTGSMWQWLDQGALATRVSAMDSSWFGGQNGKHDLYGFGVRSSADGNVLFESHYDSANGWELQTHGAPPQTLLARQPAVSGAFGGPIESWPTWRVNVFVQTTNNRIYRRIWAPGIYGIWLWSWGTSYCQM